MKVHRCEGGTRGRVLASGFLVATLWFHAPGAAGCRASADAAGHPEPIRTIEGITEYTLANGLQVLLCPDPSTPTITVVTTYRVGSMHEGRGEAGMAHMLEHMMGKGTRDFEATFEALAKRGAEYNATTWFDRTNFYETLTASDENLEFAIHLEAQRMHHANLDAGELATEMDVITNEVQMMENDPKTILSQRMLSAAYLWHNYGKTTIGNLSDIQRYPVENLRRFYRHYYRPENATLYVSGRFDTDRAFDHINHYFGAIPAPDLPLMDTYTEEPVQDGSRHVALKRAGGVPLAGLLYHTPSGSHPDAPALLLLHNILTSAPSGRLHEALVSGGLATRVDIGDPDHLLLAEPGVMEIIAECGGGQDPEELLDEMTRTVEELGEARIDEREVKLARARVLKKLGPIVADSGKLGIYLSEWIAQGDWRLFFVQRDRLNEVTPEDVERVARTYLVESNRTTGVYIPTESPARAQIPPKPDVQATVAGVRETEGIPQGEAFVATPEEIRKRTLRVSLPPGMKVALLQKRTRGQRVAARFRFHYGTEEDLAGYRIALRLLPDLLMRGTRDRDASQLQDELDLLQCNLEIAGYEGVLGASIETDREHLVPALEILAEILQKPAFAPEEFEILKKQRLAELDSWLGDPIERSLNALRRGLYPWPEGNIHYIPTLEEEIDILRDLSPQTVKSLYTKHIGASHAEVSVVGDFDDSEVLNALGRLFESWESPSPYEWVAMPYLPIQADAVSILTPDRQMAMVTMATLMELRDDDPDYPAVKMASYILTESGRPRMANRLRHQEGFSYHTSGRMTADDRDRSASLYVFSLCSPQNVDPALQAMREEMERWIEAGITEEELAAAKKSFAEEFELELADDAFVARQLTRALETGRSFSYHADLQGRVQSLTAEDVLAAIRRHLGDAPFIEIQAGDL
jgi:zinc protease